MRKQSSLFLVGALLSGTFLLGAGSAAVAQEDHAHMAMPASAPAVAAKQTRWSDPASWPDRKVPKAGDAVTIARDKNILLDVAPPALRSLIINGKLSFADTLDLELKSEWILLGGGELAIGSEAKPHTRKATITLTDTVPNEDVSTMGDRGIMLLGGTLNLHGDRANSWTKLAKTAKAGSIQIAVLNAAGWRKGDQIVLASTDFDSKQAEERTITAVSGNTLTLDKPLQYMHFGEITFGVDERGEVGLLTRNIKIQASDDAEKSYFGGHIMAMAGSKMYVSSVELTRMGQNMHLARYPIHWHILGEGQGQYVRNSAIHNTYSRCVTVHGTNNLKIENNVTFNTVGHCYFLEDAVETGNQFVHNLGIMTKCHPDGKPCVPTNLSPGGTTSGLSGQKTKDVLIPSDNTASTFWITNPNNIYRNNVAAGSEQIGFWFAFPEQAIGAHEGKSPNTRPRQTHLGEFSGNTSHSNFDGFMFDRGPKADGSFSVVGSNYHIGYVDPTDTKSAKLEAVFDNFTAYKNRNNAIWSRGELHTFKNLKLADNAIGYTHAAGRGPNTFTSQVVDSLFVGESANIGNPRTPAEIAYGRSLPEPALADFPIRGYEYYDFRHDVKNVTFRNFEDNATRKASAISYLMYTSFGISTENGVEGLKFDKAKPVYFPPVDRKWANDFGSRSGYMGAAIHDRDGSIGGTPNSYIVIDNGITPDPKACEMKASWNAAICRGDLGRLSVGGVGGPGALPVAALAAAPGAAPGAPPGAALGAPGGAPRAAAGPRPPADPIMISRNGKQVELTGETSILSGSEVKVDTARKAVNLALREMDKGSWVIFELPGFATSAAGTAQSSLAALRNASSTSYFKEGDTLWVKLVVADTSGPMVANAGALGPRTSLEVSR
ncbi:MAG: G8 domain-containing protein [Sphingobium sp.]|nr:G8 domain-containing protein [Sphingobium sp.]